MNTKLKKKTAEELSDMIHTEIRKHPKCDQIHVGVMRKSGSGSPKLGTYVDIVGCLKRERDER
jgi:hypothetical protein